MPTFNVQTFLYIIQGIISLCGVLLGITLICLDRLGDSERTYINVGVTITCFLVGSWLPEPASPNQKGKKTKDLSKKDNLNRSTRKKRKKRLTQKSNRSSIHSKRKSRSTKEIDLESGNAVAPIKGRNPSLKANRSKNSQSRTSSSHDPSSCCCLSCLCSGSSSTNSQLNKSSPKRRHFPCSSCYYCLQNILAMKISKKTGKFFIFLVRSILSILGMIAGIILIVLDFLNDGKGPYFTIGTAFISTIIGYWLPSPSKPDLPRNGRSVEGPIQKDGKSKVQSSSEVFKKKKISNKELRRADRQSRNI